MQFTFLNKKEKREKKIKDFVAYCNKIEQEPEQVFLWLPKKIDQKIVWLEKVTKTAKWGGGNYELHKPMPSFFYYWKIVYINPKEKAKDAS